MPLNRGPGANLPSGFNELLQAQAEMKQLDGVAEAKPEHTKALVGG